MKFEPIVALCLVATLAACDSESDHPGAASQDAGTAGVSAKAESAPAPAARVEPAKHPQASTDVRSRGAQLYARQCVACHGDAGLGDGEAAYLLYPKPRDFRAGIYRYTSTWEGVPTDDDLYRTLSRGMPGSAMPSWAHLSEEDRRALVAHVKSLAEKPLVIVPAKAGDPAAAEAGEGVVEVPAEPADDAASRARGAALFAYGRDGQELFRTTVEEPLHERPAAHANSI
jgi:mono/diheme cytochrome c family protein